MSAFIGRREELATARQRLSDSRFLTLTGTGGVGKSRLAVRVAADSHRAFRDGAYLVRLDELHDPALLSSTIALHLGLADGGSHEGITMLLEFLRDKQVLLVLDNCEHLLRACGLLVHDLLRSCPEVRVLATSREALVIEGESVLVVPPLPTLDPDELGPSTPVPRHTALELFAERARAVDPAFRLTPDNQRVVAEICATLDGLPLAIELAAVRLRSLTPEEILELLSDRFQLLTTGSKAGAVRHQTLRASLDWSFELCTPEEQLLWSRLSVFAGTFELDAAAGVCSSGEAATGSATGPLRELVASLVEKSVLDREVRGGRTRYRILNSVRQYGAQRLKELGEDESARDRHLEWYAALVQLSQDEWFSARQVVWVHRLTAENANLRAALEHGINHADLAATATRMAVQLGEYWLVRGRLVEGRHWVGQLMASATQRELRARLLCLDSVLASMQGLTDPALEMVRAAGVLARQLGSRSLQAEVNFAAGYAATFTGDAAATIDPLEADATRFADTDDRARLVRSRWLLAAIHFAMGDQDGGVSQAERCLPVAEEAGEVWMRATLLWWLGLVAWQRRDLARAAELLTEKLKLSLELDDALGKALGLEALAWLAATEERSEHAALLLGAARGMWRVAGTRVTAMAMMGSFHAECERLLEAQLGVSKLRAGLQRGASADIDDVVRAALGQEPLRTDRPKAAPADGPALTRREAEVARLIAYGMTDRQIATKLVIAQRTAEWHVERILRKLDFSSRAQIAAWWSAQSVGGSAPTP